MNQGKNTIKRAQARPKRTRVIVLWLGRGVLAFLAVLVIAIGVGVVFSWRSLGKAPAGERVKRMRASPQSADGSFVNPQPLWNDLWGSLVGFTELSPHAETTWMFPVRKDVTERLFAPASPLRATWLGHSTVLLELGGKRVLTDPMFGESPFPIPSLGPQRWYAPVLPLESLRDVDAVLISHDHYDHLDEPTISQMVDWETTFIAPLGVGAHLAYWGVPEERIIELDWWQEHQIGELKVVSVPARHASGRQAFDQDRTLWTGYALISPERRALFSGDTGLFDEMSLIGEKFGPFDLVMIEVGAYSKYWPDWHIGPEQAIHAHKMMRGKLFMPIHWGLFNLALHAWTEPVERVTAEAKRQGVAIATPRPGEVFDIDTPPAPERWWPQLPYQSAQEAPIISTKNGDPNERYSFEVVPE